MKSAKKCTVRGDSELTNRRDSGCSTGWIIRFGNRKICHFIGTLEEAARYSEEHAEENEAITII